MKAHLLRGVSWVATTYYLGDDADVLKSLRDEIGRWLKGAR